MKTQEKVLIHKGIDRIKRGQFEEAKAYLERALELNPESSDAWNSRGVALYKMGMIDQAIEDFRRALDLNPKNLDPLRNMCFMFRSLGMLDEALGVNEEIMARGGGADDLEVRATIFAGLGRLEDALEAMSYAVELKPSPQFKDELKAIMEAVESGMNMQPSEGREETS